MPLGGGAGLTQLANRERANKRVPYMISKSIMQRRLRENSKARRPKDNPAMLRQRNIESSNSIPRDL